MKKNEIYTHVTHTFGPVYDERSRVLILGSFPSVKSREQQFYYGHPRNRFWKVIARIKESAVPQTVEAKKKLLLEHHIAVWDVIASCDIIGSSDSSIKNVIVNDFSVILEESSITKIYANGGKAYDLYLKYAQGQTGVPIEKLPSTSPANAAWSLERLIEEWRNRLEGNEGNV